MFASSYKTPPQNIRGNPQIYYSGGATFSYYEKIGDQVTCIDDEIPFEIPTSWAWCRGSRCFAGTNALKPFGAYFDYIDIDAIDNKKHMVIQPKHLAVRDAPSRANRAVQNGSVLFSMVRPYLKNIAYVDKSLQHCIASTGFYVCNSTGCLNPEFMFKLMLSDYVVKGLSQFMKGDNSPSINKEDIENWLYPIPPYQEQKIIVKRLDKLESIICTIEESLS